LKFDNVFAVEIVLVDKVPRCIQIGICMMRINCSISNTIDDARFERRQRQKGKGLDRNRFGALIEGKNTKYTSEANVVAKTQTCIFEHSSAKIYVKVANITGWCTQCIANTLTQFLAWGYCVAFVSKLRIGCI
jgi:hypothetical protein